MTPFLLLIACIFGVTSGTTYFTTYNTENQFFIGGHQITVVTEPIPKLYVDGQFVDLATAGSRQDEADYSLYSDFSILPGFSLKLYKNGAYTVYYEHNGVVSRFGTLTEEEQKQMQQQMQATFDAVNQQFTHVQQQMGNIMQSMSSMFGNGWPFFG